LPIGWWLCSTMTSRRFGLIGTILAIPHDGDGSIWQRFGGGLSGIYRSYRKANECVYVNLDKEVLHLVGRSIWLQKWQHWLGILGRLIRLNEV